MLYDPTFVTAKLIKWEKYMKAFSLPAWEQLPPIELYMDQVLALLPQYLSFLPREEKAGTIVSASAINNYVRLKVMPPPNKKKYARIHIAYLIILCCLKQALNISDIQRIIPANLSEEEMRVIYNDFAEKHKEAALFFISQAREMTQEFMADKENQEMTGVDNLVVMAAIVAGLSKLLVEKVVGLQHITLEDSNDPALPEIVEQIKLGKIE